MFLEVPLKNPLFPVGGSGFFFVRMVECTSRMESGSNDDREVL